MQAALTGELTDATRRQTEAQEHATFQWSKKKEKLEMIGKWHDEKHQKVSELNGMKTSIKQKAREIGDQSGLATDGMVPFEDSLLHIAVL